MVQHDGCYTLHSSWLSLRDRYHSTIVRISLDIEHADRYQCLWTSIPRSTGDSSTSTHTPQSSTRSVRQAASHPCYLRLYQWRKLYVYCCYLSALIPYSYLPAAPVTCNSGLYCATTNTFVGCCESANCRNIFTSCYDLLGDTCDQACQNNPQNLLWCVKSGVSPILTKEYSARLLFLTAPSINTKVVPLVWDAQRFVATQAPYY